MKKLTAIFWLIIAMYYPLHAQSNRDISGLGSWNILNIRYEQNKRWSGFIEGQIRSLGYYKQFHYNEVKGGITYQFNPAFLFTAGFGSYNTYSEGGNFQRPILREELRNWQQIILNQPKSWVRIEHRYRAEQRFTNVGFRNRFRYRLQLLKPFGLPSQENEPFFVYFWNEIFLTDRPTYFERNRFFIGLGWRVTQDFTFQTGWIRQFDYNISDEIGKNFLQVSFSVNIRSKSENSSFINQISN